MKIKYIYIVGLWLAGLSIGIAGPVPEELSFLVPKEAKNVEVKTLLDKRRVQIIYKFKIKYPNMAIGEDKREKITSKGWRRCKSKNPGWSRFVDSTEKKVHILRRNMNFWVKENKILTISMDFKYLANDKGEKKSDDKNYQRVVILIDKYENLDEIANYLEIDCPGFN